MGVLSTELAVFLYMLYQCVLGEVYEVDDKMLELLDQLEDHPKYYERKVSLYCVNFLMYQQSV